MYAAGIVADHPAQIAVFMRGRIRTESEIEFVRSIAKLIQHAAGLHPGIFLLRINFNDLVQVFGEINDHGDVAGLSCRGWYRRHGAATARCACGQWRRSESRLQCCLRYDDADGDLAIV